MVSIWVKKMVSCNLSDDTCVVSIYKRPMEKNLGSMKHLLLVGFLCFSGLVRFMRILPGSSLETPEVGCEVLKRGHVVFSIKQYANTMILIRFLDFCYYKMFYRVFSGPIGLYSSLPFRWTWGVTKSWESFSPEDPQFLFDCLRGQRAPLRSNFKSWPEIYFLKGWLDMGSWDVNFRAIDTLDFVNVTLVLAFGSLIFQHGWSGFASMNFGSGKNIAITQDKTWLRQGISISGNFWWLVSLDSLKAVLFSCQVDMAWSVKNMVLPMDRTQLFDPSCSFHEPS